MQPIKLMIVDDHPLFRQGLVDVLDTDDGVAVVAVAANGDTAIYLAEEQQPDIVLMDVNLPDMNGLQVTRRILALAPATKIIILTGYDDAEQVYHAMQLGAVAYCAKDVPPEGLLNTIHAVYGGNYVIHNQVLTTEEIATWFQRRATRYSTYPTDEQPSATTTFTPLSPREMEILELVTRGASNKEVAHRLTISQQTVKNHMTAVLRKLRVDDRTQAAVYALRHGWVRLDSATPSTPSE